MDIEDDDTAGKGKAGRMPPTVRRFYAWLGVAALALVLTVRLRFWSRARCIDVATEGILARTYRRHLEEMHLAVQTLRTNSMPMAGSLDVQNDQLQKQLFAVQAELAQKMAQLEQLQKSPAFLAQNGAAVSSGSLPRMTPTLERMALPSDAEDWSKRPKRAPTFEELYQQLYGKMWDSKKNVITTFPNPYKKVPSMSYPHSSLWLEGHKIMERIVQELAPNKIKFIVEAGSMHGGSAISMAMQLDKFGLKEVPIMCVDPFSGDLNMWLNRVVWEHLDVRDGRATIYDQFMINVRKAIEDGKISNKHITPFPVSSIIGARWLQATAFAPNLIYLDSAHEIDETYYELCLYWNILEPGGILMGDDYGWLAVKTDVDRFMKDYGLQITMFGVYYNWFVKKPAV